MVQADKKLSLAHRSRFDIIANILRVATDGARKTHIMYKCNLSFRQLHTYLDFLTEKGLVKCVKGRGDNTSGVYVITSKGKSFIQTYSNIRALLSTAEAEPNE